MRINVKGHKFNYEMEKLLRIFMPNERIFTGQFDDGCEISTEVSDRVYVKVSLDGFTKELSAPLSDDDEMQMGRLLYTIMSEYTGFKPKWGVLTGVRPSKLLIATETRLGEEAAFDYFMNDLLVSEEKYVLAKTVADCEERIIKQSGPDSFSLYISIPFCPSRCSYCSFVSHSVENEKAKALIPEYVNCLIKEIEHCGKLAEKLGLKLESVYMGGGTPTILTAEQMSQVLKSVNDSFDMKSCREFTVEAGRPDTITGDKLRAISDAGAGRISINPQTFSDEVLERIGRRHKSGDITEKFRLARDIGFENINMDLIAGLPGDTEESFAYSVETAIDLDPENITVHTLALKRSSRINLEDFRITAENANKVDRMLDCAQTKLSGIYHPYYMYRQSKSAGSLENVGWSKEKRECIYNIYMMEECHTILAAGAGAVTKLKSPDSDAIERIFNFKYPFEYISGFDELIKRKERITEFYKEGGKEIV